MKRYIIQSAVVCFLLCALCFTACDAIGHGVDADYSKNESTVISGDLTEDSDSTEDNSSFEGSDSTEDDGSFEGSDSTEDDIGQGGGLELPEDKFE